MPLAVWNDESFASKGLNRPRAHAQAAVDRKASIMPSASTSHPLTVRGVQHEQPSAAGESAVAPGSRAQAGRGRRPSLWLASLPLGAALLAGCGGGSAVGGSLGTGQNYAVTTLASDTSAGPYASTHLDPFLVNGWGVAMHPAGFVWVSDAGSATATFYDGGGAVQPLVVSIPAGAAGTAGPTGIVYNGSASEFEVGGAAGAPAQFIFASLAGTISGWAPSVNPSHAITMVDNAATGSVYTGLALATRGAARLLYAADFRNGRVDVFDSTFAPVALAAGAFSDPKLPAGYAPFGIQAIDERIYVTYAQPDPLMHQKRGAGLGVLDVFDSGGMLISQLVPAGGVLAAPWGVALAPADFGRFGNALLVGNFGDGKVNAFDAGSGRWLGALSDAAAVPIRIDGLWGIGFGSGAGSLPSNTLFFAAGPGEEMHGAFGRIDVR